VLIRIENPNRLTAESNNPNQSEAEAFYSGAFVRIIRIMPVLAVLGTALLWWQKGNLFMGGFVAGCLIAYVNFYWLKRVVNALAERATNAGQAESGTGVVVRFMLRYGLIAIAAYVILRFSKQSLYGMFTGLFLPVAAIACEAAYEAYVAIRRGL
jgi:small-conductance mechanosensitive channel